MTAYVAATLKNLLFRNIALSMPRPVPASHSIGKHEAAQAQPALFRSEGFAEDLLDSQPSH